MIGYRLLGLKETSWYDMFHSSGILETNFIQILLKTRLLFFNFISKLKGDPLSYLSDKTIMSVGPEYVTDHWEIKQSSQQWKCYYHNSLSSAQPHKVCKAICVIRVTSKSELKWNPTMTFLFENSKIWYTHIICFQKTDLAVSHWCHHFS